MGNNGKLDEKNQALILRKQGCSYSQILKQVKVSKSTLSRWCKDIILSPGQLEILIKRKLKGSEKGRIIGAKKQQQLRVQRDNRIKIQALKELGKLTKRDRFLAGIGLYLGDGAKWRTEVNFTNSNPIVICFMISWLKEFCQIHPEKFRGQIWIHDNLDKNKAEIYWSNITGISQKQLFKTYISKNKTNTNKIRKNIHQYGVFSIRVMDSKTQRKILAWSAGVLDQKVVKS